MGKSQRLSQTEIRDGFRLLGETCELGHDPTLWRLHLATGLCRLVGATTSMLAEERIDGGNITVLGFASVGYDSAAAQAALAAWHADGGPIIHPMFPVVAPIALLPWTRTRRELVPNDREWYGSRAVSEYQRASDADDVIHSRQPIPRPGWANQIGVHRPFAAPPFSVRERQLVHLVHEELARLWHRPPPPDPADALPPRFRPVVDCYRRGLSAKEAARHLGLKVHTVQAYTKDLYSGSASAAGSTCSPTSPRPARRSGPDWRMRCRDARGPSGFSRRVGGSPPAEAGRAAPKAPVRSPF